MSLLRPQRFGKVPDGLTPYHREFLQKVSDAVAILIGAKKAQADTASPPLSQAVTFGDLATALAAISGGGSLNVKVGTITRDMDAASGDVSYSGVGFTPKLLIFAAAVQTTSISVGFSDGTTSCVAKGFDNSGSILFAGGSGKCIALHESAIASQDAELTSLDTDGWTLAWTKAASPSGATITIGYLAIG